MRKNNKGFTLIEMLIVVAIIAILVAVSIPLVNNSLERTRQATDAANERAAKAEAIIQYLGENLSSGRTMYYDAASGKLQPGLLTSGYGKCSAHNNCFISVTMGSGVTEGEVTVDWVDTSGSTIDHSLVHNANVP